MTKTKQTLTRGERIIRWIERRCYVPEGRKVGQRIKLTKNQKKSIIDIYDNPAVTRTAIISMARKNAKTSLVALLVLVHLAGPEHVINSQLNSAAQSRDQAALIFDLAAKIVRMSPELSPHIHIKDATKQLVCPQYGTKYRALS